MKTLSSTTRIGLVPMTEGAFTEIDVSDIIDTIIVDPTTTVQDYFGRLIDVVFNRPMEVSAKDTKFTKTEIRQMYKRAYPKAKV